MLRAAVAAVVVTALVFPTASFAAGVCTQADKKAVIAALGRYETALRTLQNTKVKDACRAAKRVNAELRNIEKTVKARPKCLLSTPSDKRSFAQIQGMIRSVEKDVNQSCSR